MILIQTLIILFRAPTNFENDQDKNSYNIYSVSLGYSAHEEQLGSYEDPS